MMVSLLTHPALLSASCVVRGVTPLSVPPEVLRGNHEDEFDFFFFSISHTFFFSISHTFFFCEDNSAVFVLFEPNNAR